MSSEGDAGFWRQVASWAWAPVTLLVGLVAHQFNARLDSVKKTADLALPRVEFEKAQAESREIRNNLREDIKELYARDDAAKDYIREGLANLQKDMHERLDRIREDMSRGFRRLESSIHQSGRRGGQEDHHD